MREALVGSVFKTDVTKVKDKMPTPLHPFTPCPPVPSSCPQLAQAISFAHSDTSTAPPPSPRPSDGSKSDCHLSTFVALSPQYRLSSQAGMALGEAR